MVYERRGGEVVKEGSGGGGGVGLVPRVAGIAVREMVVLDGIRIDAVENVHKS